MSTLRPVVLVVEDEESFIEALGVGLEREGFDVRIARDGREALDLFDRVDPDLVLLDLMLPGISGIDVCRQVRARSATPVIMVTAKDTELDTVLGLELGADDYVTKPYRLRELVARMRAVLRRSAAARGEEEPGEMLESGRIRLDLARHELRVDGAEVALPRKEFELLALLMSNPGRALTRGQLIDHVWGPDYVGDTKTLDVHVKRVRTKIEEDAANPKRITTIRGIGYRFEPG